MMCTTIEKALQSLLKAEQPLTVANVLSAYLEIAGFTTTNPDTVSEDAIMAFEHALDKHPAPPPPRKTKSGKLIPRKETQRWSFEVAKLRDEYWIDRLGVKSCAKCKCRKCGRYIGSTPAIEEAPTQKKRVVNKRGTKKRIVKRKAEIKSVWDPYAPSTSAFVL
ncbi:hypothetical protein QCA50_020544 [Cerrena zonata]|uniref:Uncharacterized protein n=1 Tax=Cerrena zonata TaxID=2478898 RepID=A0AAW0F7K5_9APHY